MNLLIIGGGAVAYVVSKLLAKDRAISEIIVGSNNIRQTKKYIFDNDTTVKKKDHNNDTKIKLVKIEASNERSILKSIENKDIDHIINASLPNYNERIMKVALKLSTSYQDLCSHLKDLKTPEQLKFHSKFRKENLLALINTGISPGVTNLLAKEAADDLDEVFSIRIRLIEDQIANEFIFSWSPEVTMDEFSSPPLIFKNGQYGFSKPFANIEKFEFPLPLGKRNVVDIYGDEVATLPRYIKTKNVDMKSGGTDIDFSRSLYKLGLFKRMPLKINGYKIAPFDMFLRLAPEVPSPKEMLKLLRSGTIENGIFVSTVEVIGKSSGKKIKIRNSAIYPDLREISKRLKGATYISYPTGLVAALFFKAIPKIKRSGVLPPEALSSEVRKYIFNELENRGVVIHNQFSKV